MRNTRAHSSVGQSSRLITERSQVQVLVGPPTVALTKKVLTMTNLNPFQKFVALISFDQESNQLQHQIQQLTQELNSLNEKLSSQQHELEAAHEQVKTAHKAVDAAELVGQELQGAENQKKQLLEQIKDKKAYQALKKELSYLQEQQHAQETILVQAWNKLETAKQQYEKHKALCQEKITASQAAIDELLTQQQALKHKISGLDQERAQKETGVPAEWLAKYANMRTRVHNPVVPVVNEACTACFYDVTPHDLRALKDLKLVECQGCFRFLYLS